ncbi:cell wall synthesis [Choiromyces venosus 120613-1]|uniref:Cell wall synthesis n=1 Tax=Choiromyces venosus 120613-1 TaxID=1336337 RepID=A0A3N4JH07_9PEZI|nr:cell wall synthesis [Choiromyces venosus 120613-1]
MSASMAIPYTLQTGPTRYAPMQTQPGQSITATETRRQYPTSAYTIFTTKGPIPNIQATITQGWDYTVTSKINTVCFYLILDTS